MLGRGIDQILPHPGNPALFERYVASAEQYVALAELANGPIPRGVGWGYVWGEAMVELANRRPDISIINLETAVTRSCEPVPKGINYKMHPENVPVLAAAGTDCCVLANNHVLDWGMSGLLETLETLEAAGIPLAGAGRNNQEASAPAVLDIAENRRVLVFAFGMESAGVPASWTATESTPGVNFLPDLSERTTAKLATEINAMRRPGDVVVASIHWGGNWGYEISRDQVAFAHRLIDGAGAHVVHGHSSHHVKALEVYRGRPILYGCGDFLNDYEGISGYEAYRDDLMLMYFPVLDPAAAEPLVEFIMVPLQMRNFRLNRASEKDQEWLFSVLAREVGRFGAGLQRLADGSFSLVWT